MRRLALCSVPKVDCPPVEGRLLLSVSEIIGARLNEDHWDWDTRDNDHRDGFAFPVMWNNLEVTKRFAYVPTNAVHDLRMIKQEQWQRVPPRRLTVVFDAYDNPSTPGVRNRDYILDQFAPFTWLI